MSLDFDQTALGALEHCVDLFPGYPGKPFQKIIHGRAIFEVFEERFYRHARALERPCTADFPRLSFDGRAIYPIKHTTRIRHFHAQPQERAFGKAALEIAESYCKHILTEMLLSVFGNDRPYRLVICRYLPFRNKRATD